MTADLVKQGAETDLGRHRRLDAHLKFDWNLDLRRMQATLALRRKRHAPEKRAKLVGWGPQAFKRVPLVTGTDVHRRTERFHLRRRHQAGMIILVTSERQAIPLDRVRDKTNRPVVINTIEGVDDRGKVVAAEIAHEARQFIVATRLDKPRNPSLIPNLVEEPLAPRRATLKNQRRV